ncbi:MAG: hypothetical protein K8S55_05330, partial [Phycisphaerae bacterium]|nr:hypothetical protein [Phycisphaerae bacterium]
VFWRSSRMGDHMKKVQPGESLKFPAATFNTFIDAARDFQNRQQGTAQQPRQSVRSCGIVLVKNNSGADVGQFGILGIMCPVFGPYYLDEFKRNIVLDGQLPNSAYHRGKFVVLLEPLASGKIGRAMVSGVTQVKINIIDDTHEFADIDAGDTTRLASGTRGSAQILWVEDYEGEKWAIVRLANPTDESCFDEPSTPSVIAWDQVNGSHWVSLDADGKLAQRQGSVIVGDYVRMKP